MAFLLIVSLLALTAGVIWALHRNQLRKQVEVVERIRDLPPLESTALPDFTPQSAAAANAAAHESRSASSTEEAAPVSAPPEVVSTPDSAQATPWQDQVKLLKDKGELNSAVQLCQQNFPRAQAFQQAAVLLRLQIRQQLDQGQTPQALAHKLYRCAVLADLFRGGVQLKPQNPREAMKQLAPVEFAYSQLGHQQLKLLTKSDVKLLEQLWGTPHQHVHAEDALGARWEELCRK